ETYPLSELERTLTLIKGVFEIRGDLNIGLDEGATFKTLAIGVLGRYGIADTLELQVGSLGGLTVAPPDTTIVTRTTTTPVSGPKHKDIFAAVEGAIMYDLVDWHVGADIDFTSSDNTLISFFAGLPVKVRVLKDKIAIIGLERILTIYTDSPKDATGSSSY